MDVYEILEEDHKAVAELLKKLDKTSEEATEKREKLFLELKTELTFHAYIEELLFYPLLKDKKESKEITLEAYEEHRLVKSLLEELDDMAKDRKNGLPSSEYSKKMLNIMFKKKKVSFSQKPGAF